MNLIRFWIFYLILQLSLQLCQQGCLSCSFDNSCLLCDLTNFYYQSGGSCILQSEQAYCQSIDINGQCLLCYSQYFLDLNTKKCIRISSENVIQNCQDYGPNQDCIRCQKNYYLNQKQCSLVPSRIEFCSYYAGISTCEQCNAGYLLNFDKKICVQVNEIDNCGKYTLLECHQCIQDYVLNKNMFYQQYQTIDSNIQKNQIAKWLELLKGNPNNITYEMSQVCQKIEVTNCEEILNYNQCQKCIQGSFLNQDQKCVVNPLPSIENCQIYLNANNCQSCANGYYLQGNQCIQGDNIENCQIYDGSKQSSQCLQCNQNFYSTGSQCQQRQNSQNVQNCQNYSLNKDTCLECSDKYLISSDGLKCFEKISNCETHVSLLSSNQELKCKKCLPGYFPESDFVCTPASDPNCDLFNQQNVCLECVNGYYLSDQKQCQLQTVIQNCEIYSPSTPNECLRCSNNFQNFRIKKFCAFQTPINNCIEYDNSQTNVQCTKCQQGFLLQNNQCDVIQVPFCAEQVQGICTKCQKGFNLTNNNQLVTCVQPLSFVKTNCDATISDQDINDVYVLQDQCAQCLSHHYPINFANHNICIKNEELQYFLIQKNSDQNCLKFSYTGNCIQCKIGLFLEDGYCVSSCQSGVYQLIGYNVIGLNEQIQVELQNFNICTNKYEEENVQTIALDSSLENRDELDIIIQCKQNTLPVITISSIKYSVLQPSKDPDTFVKLPNLKFPQIEQCVQPTQDSLALQNCQYYTEVQISSDLQYRCLKCEHQYTSTIIKYSNSSYALENCILNSNCTKDNFYPGLDLIWRKLFSCHKCNASNQIPVLFIYAVSSYDPTPFRFRNYSLEELKRTDDNNITNNNIKCLEFKPENIGYDVEDEGEMKYYKELPQNCALAVVNLRVTNGDSLENQTALAEGEDRVRLAHYCAACKPGYRATNMNDIYQFIKIKCEYIDNCQGFNWFNSCSQCQQNYTYQFSNDKIMYDRCIQSNDRNCYAVSIDNLCQKCIKGYQLNKDNICEQIKPSNCQNSDMFAFKQSYDKNSINYGLFTSSQGYGCLQCVDGYTSIQLNHTQQLYQCIQSNYLQQNFSNLKTDTNYIKNCINYGIKQDKIVCTSCNFGYSLDDQQTKCYQVSQDCEIASDNDYCIKCKIEFFLVNGKCLKQSVPFCKIPSNDTNNTLPRCIQCEPGYYITQEQKCELGQVPNCEIFENYQPLKCKQCLEQHAIYQSSTRSYCYKLEQSLRCLQAEVQIDVQYGAPLSCNECIEDSDILTRDTNILNTSTICMEFQNVSFCEEYDKGQSLSDSTLNCKQCQQGYFLTKEYTCARRNYESQLCEEYDQKLDQCKICDKEQSFLNQLGQCQQNPKGISNCFQYININTCQKCKETYYLSNNKCYLVEQDKQIQNCRFYLNDTQCDQCKQGYFLADNQCQSVLAQNCQTVETPNKCQSCKQGYILQSNDDRVDCVLLNKPNCLQFQQENNNQCLICAPNYYPNLEGNCQQVSQVVNNCKQYELDGVCKVCEKEFTLSMSKNACLSLQQYYKNYDQNCQIYKNQISCNICDLGFFFKDGQCVSCQNLGCGICDISNVQKCYVCKPGFYMNQSGNCIAIQSGLQDSFVQNFSTLILIYILLVFQLIF